MVVLWYTCCLDSIMMDVGYLNSMSYPKGVHFYYFISITKYPSNKQRVRMLCNVTYLSLLN